MKKEYESPKAELTKFDVIDLTTVDISIPPVDGSSGGTTPIDHDDGFDVEVW